MTTKEWLDMARAHAPKLEEITRNYHPVNTARKLPTEIHRAKITAPGAEAACQVVREQVRKNSEGDPVARLTAALAAGDVPTITNILNQVWFGVPETTACWRIPGFREAVDLLEDPPDDSEEEESEQQRQ